MARGGELHHDGGTVRLAGTVEVLLDGRAETGRRRAVLSDVFYYVVSSVVEVAVGRRENVVAVQVRQGDFVGVSSGRAYAFRNAGQAIARLVFFMKSE